MTEQEEFLGTGGWRRAWEQRLPHIDELIVSYTRRCGELSADRLRRLTDEVRLWFDQEVPHISYDPGWQTAKSDPLLLQELLERRFSHLLHENRLCLSVVETQRSEE